MALQGTRFIAKWNHESHKELDSILDEGTVQGLARLHLNHDLRQQAIHEFFGHTSPLKMSLAAIRLTVTI